MKILNYGAYKCFKPEYQSNLDGLRTQISAGPR